MTRALTAIAACSIVSASVSIFPLTVADAPPVSRTAVLAKENENRCDFATTAGDGNPFTCDEYRDDLVPFLPPGTAADDEIVLIDQRTATPSLDAARRRVVAKEDRQ